MNVRLRLSRCFQWLADALEPADNEVMLRTVVELGHPFLCPRCGMGQTPDHTHELELIDILEIECANAHCEKTFRFREPWDRYTLRYPR